MGGGYYGANRNGRSKGQTFSMFRHDLMDSPAWLSLGPVAISVYTMVIRRFNSKNNGDIPLSCREVSERLKVSKDTASRAFDELMGKGFLKIGEDSSFDRKTKKSRRWVLTHEPLKNSSPTNEWKLFKI
jgi:hypothetical protein